VLRSRVVLPVVALYNAWYAEGLSELHQALVARPDDVDDPAVADGDISPLLRLTEQGWDDLERSGLSRGRQIHPDLGRTLRLVARASTEYYGWFTGPDDQKARSALVATSGDDAVRVVMTPDLRFVLEPIKPEDAAQALVAVLPEVGPGRGGSISVAADALSDKPVGRHSRGADDEGGMSFMQSTSMTDPGGQQVESLRKLLQQRRTGGGQLYVAGRDRSGRRQRCPSPLSYFDTETGRYVSLKQPGRDGTPWVTVMPADFRTLAGRLQQLTSTLAL
jgi:hypothetical protein